MWDKRKKAKTIEELRWERLVSYNKPSNRYKKKSQFENELVLTKPAAYREREVKHLDTRAHHTYKKRDERYTGEMAERERLAQEELYRKKSRVAPAYSKGAYQYISDETDISDLGRKK